MSSFSYSDVPENTTYSTLTDPFELDPLTNPTFSRSPTAEGFSVTVREGTPGINNLFSWAFREC